TKKCKYDKIEIDRSLYYCRYLLINRDGAVNQHYQETEQNRLTAQDKQMLGEQPKPGAKDSVLQAEKFGGDTPAQQGSGTATTLDSVSGQSNPNIIY
ncbi:unnamed protein product, partial [Didymodactylos carnosus]